MKLTKDECRILFACIYDNKYNLVNDLTKEDAIKTIEALTDLERRLNKSCEDGRRNGRTSQNSFNDTLKRFVKSISND
jgi:hypothetical protein